MTRDIDYGLSRIFSFNSVEQVEGTNRQSGCVVKRIRYGELEVDGYTEKRALDDGHDATDVFLGRRRITLIGTVYGQTKGELFDILRLMRYSINPRLAYDESPGDNGYLPLVYWETTDELATYDTGTVQLMMRCRAVTGVVTDFDRDQQGASDGDEMSAPFQVTFEAIDPRVYLKERVDEPLEGSEGTLTLINRGGHPAPINLVLVKEAHPDHDFEFTLTVGGVSLSVTFPASAEDQVVRVDGYQKVVTMQQEDVEVLRMDLWDPGGEWPTVPQGEVAATWNIVRDDAEDGMLLANSRLWYRETFS